MKEGKEDANLLLGEEGGGTLLLLRTPPALLVGLDMAQWRVGKKFKGVRCIDRGCHFLHWTECAEAQSSSETPQEAECTYTRMRVDEAIGSTGQREEEAMRYAAGVEHQDFIHCLGVYPRHMRAQWKALTSNISKECVRRVEPIGRCLEAEGMPLTAREQELIRNSNSSSNSSSSSSSNSSSSNSRAEEGSKKTGRRSHRVSFKRADVEGEEVETEEEEEVVPLDEEDEAAREKKDNAEAAACKMFYLEVKPARAAAVSAARAAAAKARRGGSDAGAAAAAAAAAVTLQCTDRSDALMQLAAEQEEGWSAILGELELAFIALVLGHHYPSFVHWKELVELMSSSEKAVYIYPDIFAKFLNAFYAQLEQAPDEMTLGALQEGNFLSSSCAALMETCYRIDREAAFRELQKADEYQKSINKALKQTDKKLANPKRQLATAAAPAAAAPALPTPSEDTADAAEAEASAKKRLQEMEEKYRSVEEAASRLFDLVKIVFKVTGGNNDNEEGMAISPLDEVLLALQGPDAPVIVDAEEVEAILATVPDGRCSQSTGDDAMQTE